MTYKDIQDLLFEIHDTAFLTGQKYPESKLTEASDPEELRDKDDSMAIVYRAAEKISTEICND